MSNAKPQLGFLPPTATTTAATSTSKFSSKKPKHATTPPLISLISGGIAGGVEGFTTYPFEFAKTRLQLRPQNGQTRLPMPKNPYSIVAQIHKAEGLRALYKGCGILVFGSVGKDAVRFLSFDTVKNAFRDPETGSLTPGRSMLAGMTAGVVASATAVTPTERIKTALIDDARVSKQYRSTMHCIRSIMQQDGFIGLYRGFVGTTLKQASSTSVRMGTYNIIKEWEVNKGIRQDTWVNFGNGAIAGVSTTVATMPFDNIKTRSQSVEVTTTVQAVKGILLDDGFRGFWRGTVMRLSRTVFSGGILFTTAEAVAKILNPMMAR